MVKAAGTLTFVKDIDLETGEVMVERTTAWEGEVTEDPPPEVRKEMRQWMGYHEDQWSIVSVPDLPAGVLVHNNQGLGVIIQIMPGWTLKDAQDFIDQNLTEEAAV